ncbi:hypothetical protein DID88_008516 [Monilinia fructigena]|uniref:Uncharacterized protein n=1 Tax=Monilinia fructigena TaxID=38457 RepID=A0A395JAQ2_9HELO|nr:hypothetical protein DID88_008516 [Monilinia fructigena]
MLLNLCGVYPYFDTDNFDRAYNTELASVTSQYPETSLGFCYYWNERVMWDRFGLSGAYGEFPGRYGGPGFVVPQKMGINPMPPTPQKRIDLIAMHSASHPAQPSQALAQNLFEEFLNPQDQPTFLPAQASQRLAAESNPQSQTPSSILAARLAFPGASNLNPASIDAQPASLTPLPPLLLPELIFKDPTTGEMITVKIFERRSFSRGADTAIEHAQAAVNKELRLSKPRIRAILSGSLTATLAGIIEEHIKR